MYIMNMRNQDSCREGVGEGAGFLKKPCGWIAGDGSRGSYAGKNVVCVKAQAQSICGPLTDGRQCSGSSSVNTGSGTDCNCDGQTEGGCCQQTSVTRFNRP